MAMNIDRVGSPARRRAFGCDERFAVAAIAVAALIEEQRRERGSVRVAHHIHAIGVYGQLRFQCSEHGVVERDVAITVLARSCLPARLRAVRIGDALMADEAVGIHDDRRGPESFDIQLALDALAAAAVPMEHEDEGRRLR